MKNSYQIFGNIFFIAQKWQDIADRDIVARIGITTKQWMLLVILSKVFTNHLPTIGEAAKAYGTSRQNLKRVAFELQKKGFVIIANDPHDNRIQRIALTGKDKQYFEGEENRKWQDEFILKFFKGFNLDELKNFSDYTKKLLYTIHNLKL